MKIATSTILPLILVGSLALAGQDPKQTAPKSTSQHKAAPLATTHPSKTPPAATMTPAGDAAPAADMKAPTTKITKEQAGTIALGTMKGAEVASSELKEVNGKQVWAVMLKEGEKKHEVMVDATEGTHVKHDAKHTKHHKEGAAPAKH
jgi:uncharacterized membrane protein YkoI